MCAMSAKLDLLDRILRGKGITAPQRQVIPQRADAGPCLLSFAQQRLWLLHQLQPASTAYAMTSVLRLSGQLDLPALRRSIELLLRRHAVLRTTFHLVDAQPVQIVTPIQPFALEVIDLSAMSEATSAAGLARWTGYITRRPFDLEQGPLLRVKLFRCGATEHVIVMATHHIVSDGWSMGVLRRELMAIYTALTRNETPVLPDLPIQYTDFAVWQRQTLQGDRLEQLLAYWRRRLEGAPSAVRLPTDRWPASVRRCEGGQQTIDLSRQLADRLRALCQESEATIFMLLLTALQMLLYRCTGQTDLVVGIVVANRTRHETEGLVGFFANTLALRTHVRGDQRFHALFRTIRSTCLDGYTHQDLPFDKLVEALQPERDRDRTPWFDILCNFDNTPQITLELPGLTVAILEQDDPDPKCGLAWYFQEQEATIQLRLVYRRTLYGEERIACLLQQFRYLLDQIAATPDQQIDQFSLVTPESRALLPDPCLPLPAPEHLPIPAQIAALAARHPDRTSVCHRDRSWTYGRLVACSGTITRCLLMHGLTRGAMVAVSGPKSFGLYAAMLAVLSGGGVLLTIDPDLGEERQRLMVAQSGATYGLFIGRPDRRTPPSALAALDTLAIDASSGAVAPADTDAARATQPLPAPLPDDPAYLFFTSGTSGVPKGVLGCHKGLSHFLDWQRQTFDIGPHDRCAQLTNLGFDVLLRDVLLPLASGATICLPDDVDSPGADRIIPWLARERISVLHTVPTLARTWLSATPPDSRVPTLRWTFFAGEPLPDALVTSWYQLLGSQGTIINLYGPTETTLAKCWYQVPRDVLPGIQPVGSPLPQTQALVLNSQNRCCGIDEAGEIVVRTSFRSLGYIDADQNDVLPFVVNPFRDDPQDLLYYTGDRGRYRPNGILEILGRFDQQVKIRGIRVEPDEVAAVAAQFADIQFCTVIARRDQDQPTLVAYLVAAGHDQRMTTELRSFLLKRLPSAMVPTTFVLLPQIPLTLNGKVDRRQLPNPQPLDTPVAQHTAPRTQVEAVLAEIWSQILKIEHPGVYDNFFDLGGHSLLATQFVAKVRQFLDVDLSIRQLFEAPTIAGLAETIELQSSGRCHTPSEQIQRAPRARRRVLISGDGRLSYDMNQKEPKP